MDFAADELGLYPLHRCKTLHWIRHAEGAHNVALVKDPESLFSDEHLDATLTPFGWEQVDKLRKHVQDSGLSNKIELVITSPFTRTMQTAVGVFGGGHYPDGLNFPPLMVSDAANGGHPAISSHKCPPFLSVELCREKMGIKPHRKRRTKREYESLFPAIDFTQIESNEDTWWKEDVLETDEEVAARGAKFLKWLWTRKEKEIAIVSHRSFLFHTLRAYGNDCPQLPIDEICRKFDNCEMRSMVFVDKGLANFTGETPQLHMSAGKSRYPRAE